MIRTYSELVSMPSFLERFNYLKLDGQVGKETFGVDRYLNQQFYSSEEWKRLRAHIIVRDFGRDLACEGYELKGRIVIHHMNVITVEDIESGSDFVFNPEYLITTSTSTHKAIHYGDKELLKMEYTARTPGDTKLW